MSEEVSELREALRKPGDLRLAEYVGGDNRGAFSIALVRRRVDVLAYVSDGRNIGTWLEGSVEQGRYALTGVDGERLDAAAEDGFIRGTATISDDQIDFALERTASEAGLRRFFDAEQELEYGFVVSNDGAVVGVARSNKGVVLGYRVDPDEDLDEDDLEVGPAGNDSDVQPRAFVRCAIAVLQASWWRDKCGDTGSNAACGKWAAAEHKFRKLGCKEDWVEP